MLSIMLMLLRKCQHMLLSYMPAMLAQHMLTLFLLRINDHFICMCTVQAYAERAKKVNEDKEKEEARREAERLRFRFYLI